MQEKDAPIVKAVVQEAALDHVKMVVQAVVKILVQVVVKILVQALVQDLVTVDVMGVVKENVPVGVKEFAQRIVKEIVSQLAKEHALRRVMVPAQQLVLVCVKINANLVKHFVRIIKVIPLIVAIKVLMEKLFHGLQMSRRDRLFLFLLQTGIV